MGKNQDDFYVHMETETQDDTNSVGSRVKRFVSQFFLFLIVCGLTALLICQIITMSSISEVETKA